MRKSLLELQYLEEQKLYNELSNVEGALDYYDTQVIYQSSSLICFIASIIMIFIAVIFEISLFESNAILINLVIILFSILSLGFLSVSIIYKNKTLNLLKKHYEKSIS